MNIITSKLYLETFGGKLLQKHFQKSKMVIHPTQRKQRNSDQVSLLVVNEVEENIFHF